MAIKLVGSSRTTGPPRLHDNKAHAYCHITPVSQYTLLEGRGRAGNSIAFGDVLPRHHGHDFFLILQNSPFFAAVDGSPLRPMAALWQY